MDLSQVAVGALTIATLIVLIWSRLVNLGQSMWHDEVVTVVTYIEPGPRAIFFGEYSTNDHMLFSVLTWLTTVLSGPTEIAYRFWSIAPALAAGIGLAYWLHLRFGTLSGLTFLLLWTTSEASADLSRQARGYGLAFAAMALLLAASYDLLRNASDSRARYLVFTAVVTGTLTLPTFVLPAAAVLIVLLISTSTRRATIRLIPLIAIPCAAWYLPVLDDLLTSTSQQFGQPLTWTDALLQPVRILTFPGHGPVALGNFSDAWALLMGTLLLLGTYTLARQQIVRAAAWVGPPMFMTVVLTALQFYVEDRFISYLFVPSGMLVAVGLQFVFEAARRTATAQDLRLIAAVLAVAGLFLLTSSLASLNRQVEQPKEANKEIGQLVNSYRLPVATNAKDPRALRYYVPNVEAPPQSALERRTCQEQEGLIVIDRPWQNEPLDTSCLESRDAERVRFNQAWTSGYMDVWILRPSSVRVGPATGG